MIESNVKNDLTHGTPWKKIIRFALPLFLGNIIQQLYNTVDAAVAGHFIGSHALAAVGSNMTIMQMAVAIFFGITMGANILISQNYGAKNYNALKNIVDTFMIFVYIASLLFTVFGFLVASTIHAFLKTPLEILEYSLSYLNIMLLGMLPMFGYNAVSAALRGIGDTKTPLLLLIVASIINVVLDIVFVTVFNMGVGGLALATVLAQTFSFIFGIIFINIKHPIVSIHFRSAKFKFSVLKDLLVIGLPTGIQMSFISVGMFVIQSLVNSFGYITMAGYNAAMRIEMFAILPAQNFGMAMATFMGQNVGAQKWDRVRVGVNSALIMSLIVCTFVATTIFFLSDELLMLITKDEEVIKTGARYLKIVSPFYLIATYLFTMASGIRGSGATFIPMLIAAVGQVFLRIPLAYFLVSILKTPDGIWIAVPISWISGSILTHIYYKSGKWKKHIRVKSEISEPNEV